jgi:hypothetical protein
MSRAENPAVQEMTDDEFRLFQEKESSAIRLGLSTGKSIISCFNNLTRREIAWLWKNRIPLGKITILAGDGGLGKTMAMIDLAARASTGFPMPDGSPSETADTIFISAEDDLEDTLLPRFIAAKADLNRIHALTAFMAEDGHFHEFQLTDTIAIQSAVDQIRMAGGNPRLVIIDPWTAFCEGTDTHRDSDIRVLLRPLAVMAEKLNLAVVLVAHLNKNSQSAAHYRISGSQGLFNAARSVFFVADDKEAPGNRLFIHAKSNLAVKTDTLAFAIAEDETGTPYADWNREPVHVSLEEAINGVERGITPEREKILDYLQEHGPSKPGDIAAAVGSSLTSTSNMLRKLLAIGKIIQPGYGLYSPLSQQHLNVTDGTDVTDETLKGQGYTTSTTSISYTAPVEGIPDTRPDENPVLF